MKNWSIILFFLLFWQLSFTQQKIICGTVTDSTGTPIPYANILIQGVKTKTTSTTDFDGNYTVKINPNSNLIFSYVGFKTQKVAADKEEINVVLEIDPTKLLDELPYTPDLRKKKTQKIKVQ
ncbi:carboxypeptidase-like regulatory domain-containing protein [Flavobacterium panacagri]|uniref:carboxypeptidase-like regulatory domain-containing protein n=1 Tax=Flavobacterium panacagri TaxID=3034146 RepID=UPI0025A578FE|nr:carboxypeptidase-like regulatory domain-containing protein [Flavobacterium panacagri]